MLTFHRRSTFATFAFSRRTGVVIVYFAWAIILASLFSTLALSQERYNTTVSTLDGSLTISGLSGRAYHDIVTGSNGYTNRCEFLGGSIEPVGDYAIRSWAWFVENESFGRGPRSRPGARPSPVAGALFGPNTFDDVEQSIVSRYRSWFSW